MSDDEHPSKNPFIRWKHHVDSSIGLTLNGLLGLPSIVSKSFYLRRPDHPDHPHPPRSARVDAMSRFMWAPDPLADAHGDFSFEDRLAWQRAHLGVDPAVNEFADFLCNSPYSPWNLRDLPPPVPRSLPFGMDPQGFSFSDAFQDLLLASAQPDDPMSMPSLQARHMMNRERRELYGDAEPSWPTWVSYYRAGLFTSYFDRPAPWSLEEMKKPAERVPPTEDGQEGGQDWKNTASVAFKTPEDSVPPPEYRPAFGGLFRELDHAFKVLKRVIEEETGFRKPEDKHQEDGQEHSEHNPSNEADTEDELYTAMKSAYAQTESSLSTLIKAVTGSNFNVKVDGDAKISSETKTSVSRSTSDSQPGGERQIVKTTEEHVDIFGNQHIKTVVRTLNANGDEISRETHYSIRNIPKPDRRLEEKDDDHKGYDDDDNDEHKQNSQEKRCEGNHGCQKKGGWFWK